MPLRLRLLGLARDPEIPRWCHASIVVGVMIPGPIDEAVIYPIVMGWLWMRRRHVLARHGLGGVHVTSAALLLAFSAAIAGFVLNLAVGLAS